MGRTFSRLFLISFCVSFLMMKSDESFGVMSVFDSSNYGNLTQIITASNKLLNEQKHMGMGIDGLNTALGSPLPFDFSLLERMIQGKTFSLNDFSRMWASIPGFETPKNDFGNKRANYERALLSHFNEKGILSHEEQQKIGQRRDGLFKESVLSGLALADFQKESLQTSQATLSSLLKDTRLSRDLRSDIALTNRLLTVLANETIQTRALLLQTLELKSAHYSQRLPISLEAQAQVSNSSPLRQNFGRKDNHG